MSLELVTLYVVVLEEVLMVTVSVPTAVTVPLWSRNPPWCSCDSGMPSFSCAPGPLDCPYWRVVGLVGLVAAPAESVPARIAPETAPEATSPAPTAHRRPLLDRASTSAPHVLASLWRRRRLMAPSKASGSEL